MIFVTQNISLADDELHFSAIRASGPGGQHVNTTNSAVQLKFDAAQSPAIRPDVLARLRTIAGQRMNSTGVILLEASETRSQHRNRAAAQERLVGMIKAAATPPRRRVKTKPTKGSIKRRLTSKARTSGIKKTRGRVRGDD